MTHAGNGSLAYIMGSPDPEMNMIQEVLVRDKARIYFAAVKDADGTLRRVRPNEAYKVEYLLDMSGKEVPLSALIAPFGTGVAIYAHTVECKLKEQLELCDCMPDYGGCSHCKEGYTTLPVRGAHFDHHNPGDRGYGKSPAEYWEGSSLGQVVNSIGCIRTDRMSVVAAADHCLAAAYAGECIGVSPDDILSFRMESRAAFQKRDVNDIMQRVKEAALILEGSGCMYIKGCKVHILLDHVDDLPEAACMTGKAYITAVEDKDGRRKVVIGGAATSEAVTAFMEIMPLDGIYGMPDRGIAGGYLPNGKEFRDLVLKVRVGGYKDILFTMEDIEDGFLFGQGCYCHGPIPRRFVEDYYDVEGGDVSYID